MAAPLRQGDFVARYRWPWRVLGGVAIVSIPLLVFEVLTMAVSLRWKTLSAAMLLIIFIGGLQVLTFRLILKEETLRLRTVFGTELHRRCDEIEELVFAANQKISIRFKGWLNAGRLRRVIEWLLHELDMSTYVFDLPRQTVDLATAGELLLRSAPPSARVKHLR